MIINSQQESFQGIGNKNYKPLIKWAGGKSRLNKQLLKVADLALNSLNLEKFNYFEPFLEVEHYFLIFIGMKNTFSLHK